MTKVEILKKHYPSIYFLLENAEYNSNQDITKYFGKTIIVIYGGHGGYGWNKRKLIGESESEPDSDYYILSRFEDEKVYQSLIHKEDWFCRIILPENFDKMDEYFSNSSVPVSPIRID